MRFVTGVSLWLLFFLLSLFRHKYFLLDLDIFSSRTFFFSLSKSAADRHLKRIYWHLMKIRQNRKKMREKALKARRKRWFADNDSRTITYSCSDNMTTVSLFSLLLYSYFPVYTAFIQTNVCLKNTHQFAYAYLWQLAAFVVYPRF